MNFKINRSEFIFLAMLTVSIGLMQVLTPLFLRTLIDGILPSKDGKAIAFVLTIIGLNELLLVFGNSLLNRTLDGIERVKIKNLRQWMLEEALKLNAKIKDPETFYQSWSADAKRLVYKRVKNPWFRTKDFMVLCLLTMICLNISYLAGILVLAIGLISFTMVLLFQEKQSRAYKEMYALTPIERRLFDEVIIKDIPLAQKEVKLKELQEIGQDVTNLQFIISKEQTRYQDINNLIRFFLMFAILGVGGYLFATEKLTMGSLWALLITMYRVTPSLQSIVRWILQTRGDSNLEDRILENMKTKESFKKPAYYNRLVKILEKAIKTPAQRLVILGPDIDPQELKNSLVLWKSFYSKKEDVIIIDEKLVDWDETKIYLASDLTEGDLPPSILIFTTETPLSKENPNKLERLTLSK